MKRLKKTAQGFTLMELVIAIAISAIVLLTSSNLLVNFGKFSAGFVKNESSLMTSSLGVFEEIREKISVANEVFINPSSPPSGCSGSSCIRIRMDQLVSAGCPTPPGGNCFSPSNTADDLSLTYWLAGTDLKRTGATGDAVGGTIIATDINSLSFVLGTDKNSVKIVLVAKTTGGAISGTNEEHFETTAVMQERQGA